MSHSEETKAKIARAVRLGHAVNPRSEESREKMSEKLRAAYARGAKIGFQVGNKETYKKTPEQVKAAHKAAMDVVRGSHGFGCMSRGIPNHRMAKHWIIKSPSGQVYEVDNLLEWCRTHVDLFPVDKQVCRQPLYQRAFNGLSAQLGALTKEGYPSRQWKGWTVEAKKEFIY